MSYNFLILDDDRVDAELLEFSLDRHFSNPTYTHLTNAEEVFDEVLTHQYDCVFVDYNLTGEKGTQTVKKLKELHKFLPVIMITGVGSEKVAIDSFKAGASDYIIKGREPDKEVKFLISEVIKNARAQKKLEEQQRDLAFLIKALTHDAQEPIKKILMFLNFIDSTDLDEDEHKEILKLLNHSANDVESMFRAIRLYVEMISSEGKLAVSEINLYKVFNEVVKDYGSLYKELNVSFILESHVNEMKTYPDLLKAIFKCVMHLLIHNHSLIKKEFSFKLIIKEGESSYLIDIVKEGEANIDNLSDYELAEKVKKGIDFQICQKILTSLGGSFNLDINKSDFNINFTIPIPKEG